MTDKSKDLTDQIMYRVDAFRLGRESEAELREAIREALEEAKRQWAADPNVMHCCDEQSAFEKGFEASDMRNLQPLLDKAVAAEREACAKVAYETICKDIYVREAKLEKIVPAAIRQRGEERS